MSKLVSDLMTTNPETLPTTSTVAEAASLMRHRNIGDVIVTEDGTICGIVTDRDIVIRALAKGRDAQTKLGDICSTNVATLEPENRIGDAIKLMEEKALRRLPVIENGKPVGIVSLGDLAKERDSSSALGQISAAPPNK
jgi:CBS domain-containing protein